MEKFDDEMPLERPELLEKCFQVLKENGRLYFDGIAADLNVKPTFLRQMVSFLSPDLTSEFDAENNIQDKNIIRFSSATSGRS